MSIRHKRNALLKTRMTPQELQEATKCPSNASNNGMAFEREIKQTCDAYRFLGIANIEKVAPPTTITGSKKKNNLKTIHRANPFLDFIGCVLWNCPEINSSGLSMPITIECKSTSRPTLPIASSSGGGLSVSQWNAMQQWQRFGMAAWVLWHYEDQVKWITVDNITKALENNQKSIKWADCISVQRGKQQGVVWDFLGIKDNSTV